MKNNRGITLIELLISIALTSIIGLGVVSLQYILSQNQIVITKSYKSVDSANYVVSNFIKEIRSARSSENRIPARESIRVPSRSNIRCIA